MERRLQIISGSSHPIFAKKIYDIISKKYNPSQVVWTEIDRTTFGNENMLISIKENVREADVFFIQTSCPPVSDNIIESFIIMDALKHSSAHRVTMVSPYWPYVRSDKKDQPRISIAAKLMARLHETAGADRFLTMELHSEQIQGFFSMPIDQLSSKNVFCQYLSSSRDLSNSVLVAPDVGESKHLGSYANQLHLPMSIIDKRRHGNTETVSASVLIGDVKDKDALIVDDEIASGGTLCMAADFLKEQGARTVTACITHPVLSGSAIDKLNNSTIDELAITDTIPIGTKDKDCQKIKTLSVTELFAEAIDCTYQGESVSKLF